MLPPVYKPLSSGTIFSWLTGSRIVTTNSLSQLATPSSISSDQSVALTGTATLTVAGLLTASSGLSVSSNATVSGTATVTGLLTASSGLSVASNVTVTGTATVTGLLTASSSLTVASTVTLSAQTANRILTTNSLSAAATPSAISTAQTLTLSTATGTTLTVSSTQASTSLVTGCALFAGGVGISGALNVSSVQSAGGIVAGTVLQATTSLQVGTTMRLGGTPLAYQAIVSTQSLSGGSTHFGLNMAPTYGSDATAEIRGIASNVTTAAAAFTCPLARAFHVINPTIGATSAITEFTAYYCAALSGAGTSYAFQSAGAGLVKIGDTTDSTSTSTGAIVCSGGIGVAKRLTLDGATGKTIKYVNGTANAAVAVTFGAVGPTGSTAGNQLGWIRIDVGGTDRYIPYW